MHQVGASSAISFTLGGFTNPAVSGATGAFQAISTTTSANVTIDSASTLPSGFTLTPASFGGTTPTITLSSYVAGASSVTVTAAFTLNNALPTSGKVVLTLPANFTLADTGSLPVTTSISDGSVTATASSRVITISRTGASGALASGSLISVAFAGVTNPHQSGATTRVSLQTTTTGGVAIDEVSQANNGAFRPLALSITPGAFTTAPTVTLSSTVSVWHET